MGAWAALSAHFIVKKPLMTLVQNLIDAKDTGMPLTSVVSIGTGLALLTLVVQAVNYESVKAFVNP